MDVMQTVILVITVSLMIAGILLAYHMGVRDGYAMGRNLSPEKVFPRWKKEKKAVETEEQRRIRLTAENIENFGTGRPQKEVK